MSHASRDTRLLPDPESASGAFMLPEVDHFSFLEVQ